MCAIPIIINLDQSEIGKLNHTIYLLHEYITVAHNSDLKMCGKVIYNVLRFAVRTWTIYSN